MNNNVNPTISELEHAFYEYNKQLNIVESERRDLIRLITEISSKIETKNLTTKTINENKPKDNSKDGGSKCPQD